MLAHLDRHRRARLASRVKRTFLCLALAGVVILRAAEPVSPAEFDAAFRALTASKGVTNDAVRLRQLFDLEWRHEMIESPESATYNGFPGQNARWSDLSKSARDRQRAELDRPLKVLATINRAALTPDEQLSAKPKSKFLSVSVNHKQEHCLQGDEGAGLKEPASNSEL